MTKQLIILGAAMLTIAGCNKSPEPSNMTPAETYQAYNQKVINGISFEDSKLYHSKAFTQKVENQIKTMQQNNSNSFEAFITLYLKSLQSMAKCNELTLASETIEGETAELIYDRTDTCDNNAFTARGEEIRMVYENGWKIDDNLSIYRGSD